MAQITQASINVYGHNDQLVNHQDVSGQTVININNLANGVKHRVVATATTSDGYTTDAVETSFITLPYIGVDDWHHTTDDMGFWFLAETDYNPEDVQIAQCAIIVYDNQELEGGTRYYFNEHDLTYNGVEIRDLPKGYDWLFRLFCVDTFGREYINPNTLQGRIEEPTVINSTSLTSGPFTVTATIDYSATRNVIDHYFLLMAADGTGDEYKLNFGSVGGQYSKTFEDARLDDNGVEMWIQPNTQYEVTAVLKTAHENLTQSMLIYTTSNT